MARKPKKNQNSSINSLRVPPQNTEAEAAVLGSLLLEKDAIIRVADLITPDDFYRPDHSLVFEAMLTLFEKRTPIDLVTLTNQLEESKTLDDIGGSTYVATLANGVSGAANVVHYANIVREKSILRRLITAASGIGELGFDESENVAAVMDRAESLLFAVSQKYLKEKFIPIKDVLAEAFDRIDKIHKDKGAIRGVPTGFRDLDTKLAGLQKSDLIIIAARPSMGKTAFALNIAENIAVEEKIAVGIFSLEMSKEQLVERLLSSQSGIDSWKLRTGNLSDEDFPKIGYAMGVLSEAPIFIDDSPVANVMEIRAKARRLQMEQNLGVIIIDYLQLMEGQHRGTDSNRVQEISEISRSLKTLARELNIPVIALSQLSRAVEQRQPKIPMLSDLRESGCLAGDTLVYNASTGERTRIQDLIGVPNLSCLGVNQNYKLNPEKALKVFSTGRKKVFELGLGSGKKIRATGNHKFLTIDGWKRLDKLQVKDFLATPRIIQTATNNSIKISDNKLIVLAHLIGDGCYLARQPLHYTNADSKCLQVVDKAAKAEFGTLNRLVKQKNWYHLYLSSPEKLARGRRNPIVRWLDEELHIFNQRSGEKHLPNIVFQLTNKQLSLFISHLFSTDGGLTKSNGIWRLHYASKSHRLIEDLQHILIRFEIHSRIKVNNKKGYDPVYDLQISGLIDQLKYLQQIGIYGAKAKNVQLAIKELKPLVANTNVDIIPKQIWIKIANKFKALGMTTRSFHAKMGWAYSGTQRYGNGVSRERLGSIAKVLKDQELKELANSDIFWDQVVAIEPGGVEEVYDITVPDIHNFVANDIIVHNSIEQDADVVMFIYREDYYDKDTERKGITDILIRKHRNGPVGEIELMFKPEQTRFMDIDRKHLNIPTEIQKSEQVD